MALAQFYCQLLGWKIGLVHEQIIIIVSDNCEVNIGFQPNEDYVPPVWPEAEGWQQQMLHMDFAIPKSRLEEWIEYVIELGGRKSEFQYAEAGDGAVMFDPEGHPFCLDIIYDT
jgi:hypothetical protein